MSTAEAARGSRQLLLLVAGLLAVVATIIGIVGLSHGNRLGDGGQTTSNQPAAAEPPSLETSATEVPSASKSLASSATSELVDETLDGLMRLAVGNDLNSAETCEAVFGFDPEGVSQAFGLSSPATAWRGFAVDQTVMHCSATNRDLEGPVTLVIMERSNPLAPTWPEPRVDVGSRYVFAVGVADMVDPDHGPRIFEWLKSISDELNDV